MNQFEQLLTCAICLDRYRNPKLLPCQHSFCMEPCMDGLVDYVRRQVKCPECRAEHRIPYQGVQAFPTNVTLKRFLDLHVQITGELPDPTSGQIMERCCVCSEKAYLNLCLHCEKKICPECKAAHMDILRREISRINNQIRRGLHKLQDSLSSVEKNTLSVQSNCTAVLEEIDEIYRRLSKALKDRTEYLRGELDRYLSTEARTLTTLKDNLELEVSNIQSNCDLADKYMNENVEWDDCELMDAKEIFLKTVEFIRNFELDTGDYNRKIRFIMQHDPNQLVVHLAGYGELNINQPHGGFNNPAITSGGSNANLLQTPGGPGLMRSKSDHRLASQFRQQEERGYGADVPDEPPRKFGERYGRTTAADRYERYGRSGGNDYSTEYDYDNDANRPARSRYRSRFARHGQDGDSDNDTQVSRGVRFTDPQHKEKERILDTEDASRGPLSGISRLLDSPRVMQKLQESEERSKKKEKEPPPPVVQPQVPKQTVPKRTTPVTQRQLSEDDEIARIKRQNKGASSSTETPAVESRPAAERVAALKQQSSIRDDSDDSRRSGTPPSRKAPASETISSEAESDESVSSLQQRRTTAQNKSASASRRSSVTSDSVSATHKKTGRSASSDSTTSSDSSGSTSAVRNTGAAYTTEEVKQKYLAKSGNESPSDSGRRLSTSSTTSEKKEPTKFQSRFLNNTASRATPAPVEQPKEEEEEEEEEEETETSSEEETESEEESEEETKKETAELAKTDIGPLLARSAQARESSADSSRKNSRDETSYGKSRYGLSSYKQEEPTSRYTRTRPSVQEEEPPSRYGSSGYQSRFLNKSKSSATVQPEEEDKYTPSSIIDDDSRYPSGRSRYMAMKDRRSRLARSKSSHNFGDDDDIDEPVTTTNPSAYLASRGYGSAVSSSNDLARSRSSHALKSRENSPERPTTTTTEKDGAALSSWARYLKNKYGNRTGGKDGRDTGSSALSTPSSTSSASRRLSLGLPLRAANEIGSSDDDSKNTLGSPTTPIAATAAAAAGIAAVTAGTTPKSQYLQKRRQLFKIGSRGSEPGCFTWPRGIAVGPDNSIVVADSSNHRVQVFDANGNFIKEFGQYGNAEGEFDCLAGVAVNRIGQYIIADRYNHRIQVFDPSGRFLRAFGSQGSSDGRFNYPWGITTDALGFIYVCDKENHRVQVFQSDGTFVGKFGSHGNKPGQLEHPHYIAVSNTNRVIVSDANNHRIQVFDVNGRVIFSFGSEGCEEGQFKFPKGVAVDDQGYIIVADSGNNRIQIFTSDGVFLRAFGCWGSGEGEFKGLEGVAVMSNGNILVCDRENHRIQAF